MKVDRISCLVLAAGLLGAALIFRSEPQGDASTPTPTEARVSRLVVVDEQGNERFVIEPNAFYAIEPSGRPLLEWRGYRAHVLSPFGNNKLEIEFKPGDGRFGSMDPPTSSLSVFNHVGMRLTKMTQWPQDVEMEFRAYRSPPRVEVRGADGEVIARPHDWAAMRPLGSVRFTRWNGPLGWREFELDPSRPLKNSAPKAR